MKQHSVILAALLAMGLLGVAGCASSPPVRFYAVAPLARPDAQASPEEGRSDAAVRVMPVEIPDYLNRPQIITRDGHSALKLSEFDRWAGSLEENMTSVVAENLAALLGSDRVFVHPGVGGEKADLTVTMQVVRLDCMPGDKVVLKARWGVAAGPGRVAATPQAGTFTAPLSDSRYETVVNGIGETLAQASRAMARQISGFERAASKTGVGVRPTPASGA